MMYLACLTNTYLHCGIRKILKNNRKKQLKLLKIFRDIFSSCNFAYVRSYIMFGAIYCGKVLFFLLLDFPRFRQ